MQAHVIFFDVPLQTESTHDVILTRNVTKTSTSQKVCNFLQAALECSLGIQTLDLMTNFQQTNFGSRKMKVTYFRKISQFNFVTLIFAHLSECHEWSIAPISTCLRRVLWWMLHWWRVSGSTARELFPCTHQSTPSTRVDTPQVPFIKSSVWPDRESNLTYQLWQRMLNQLCLR